MLQLSARATHDGQGQRWVPPKSNEPSLAGSPCQCEGVAKIETTDVPAAGRRGGRGLLYAYRVRGLGRSAVVLWIGGEDDEPDHVLALPEGDHFRVPLFATVRQARMYADRRGRRLACPEADTLELGRVQRWLENPARRNVPSGALLEAWNFFEDLAGGLGEVHRLPPQNAVHDSAYEKLFGGECSTWTPTERRAVLELVTAGVELWNSCPSIVKPRSNTSFGRGRGTSGDL
ncbi:hypothetical protein [Streptomyces sp. NPDC096324]|uniref:hypothetical protein n=1 Tax=Streptomyces sp. NPDC096324 TaxID=3366085 RepID=UPI00382F7458